MKKFFYLFLLSSFSVCLGQSNAIDLANWKLELPSGYTASDWKLSNFQNDRFCKPFFYLDSIDGALVMEAYPAEGKSTAKYTKTSLREQMEPGNSNVNWTFEEGAVLKAEFQVVKMSKEDEKKYHRTLLFQIEGRTTEEQTEKLGLSKPESMPYLKVFWQNERIRIQRRVLKDMSTVGDALFNKNSWEEDEGRYSKEVVGFEKVNLTISVEKGRIEIQINDEKPILLRDISVKQWYFENYFNAGNYLQANDEGAHSIVKFYSLNVSH